MYHTNKIWLVIVGLAVTQGAPFFGMDNDSESVAGGSGGSGPNVALTYLRKFGYLESLENNASETLYSEKRVTEAIRLMQYYGAVPETGKLDNATIAVRPIFILRNFLKKKLLTTPRCGVPDIVSHNSEGRRKKRFVLGSNGWNKRKLTYRLENVTPQLRPEDVHADLLQAMNIWGNYARLKFINKTDSAHDEVDIAISFGRGYHGDRYPFDGEGGTLAHAFFPQNYPGLSGDIHFDEDEKWYHQEDGTSIRNRGMSFVDVALHELGHSLGLAHSPSQDSVMFPYYQAPKGGERQLGHDDIMALYHLYISRNIDDVHDEKPTPRTTPSPRRTTSTPTRQPNNDSPSTRTITTDNPTTTFRSSAPTSPKGDLPDLCKGEFDSIAFIRNELFVFRGEYMWRWIEKGRLAGGTYPTHTARLFPILRGVKKVDAAFERESDGSIVFLSEGNYWTYDGDSSHSGEGPQPLSDFGLPVDGVDAAFVWGKNHQTYFFKNDQYWKYNETSQSVKHESGYPASIPDRWRGIPSHITSVITYKDGKTYFFKGQEFWRFSDTDFHTEEDFPQNTGRYWFNCAK